MKVGDPKFYGDSNRIECLHCPFADKDGIVSRDYHFGSKHWATKHEKFGCVSECPTAETYAEACALAEAAEKEGR